MLSTASHVKCQGTCKSVAISTAFLGSSQRTSHHTQPTQVTTALPTYNTPQHGEDATITFALTLPAHRYRSNASPSFTPHRLPQAVSLQRLTAGAPQRSLHIGVKNYRALDLTDKLPATAKALSQVSRSVRVESLSIYYSVNDFTASCFYWPTTLEAQQEVSRIDEWFALFGEVAARHVRALLIWHLRIYKSMGATYLFVPSTLHLRRMDVFPHWDAFYDEYRAAFRARIARQSNHLHWDEDLLDHVDQERRKKFPVGAFTLLANSVSNRKHCSCCSQVCSWSYPTPPSLTRRS